MSLTRLVRLRFTTRPRTSTSRLYRCCAKGAHVNAQDDLKSGDTPLGEIAQTCTLKMAQLLIDAGADPTIRGSMQLSAIDRAAKRRRGDGPRVYRLLCEISRRFHNS